ncbi:hypothetical protein ACN47E_001845 [Coniothyrium glycines]
MVLSTTSTATLQAHFQQSPGDPRPILTSLNNDNSWLISFPRPVEERQTTGKAYYHLVHDPWLNGPVSAYANWILFFTLSSPAKITTGAAVEDIVRAIEALAAAAHLVSPQNTTHTATTSPIDAISINLHYPDHMHKPTLLTFAPSIPVLATPEAATLIRSWNHFTSITQTKDLDPASFTGDWTTLHPGAPLPPWLTRFRTSGHHELNFVNTLLWSPAPGVHEAILHSPHGMYTAQPSLQCLLHASQPRFRTLALLHGLKENWGFGIKNTFGVATGLELQRQSGAKYWIRSHDDALRYTGVVGYFVKDVFRTLEWGVSMEAKDGSGDGEARKEVKVTEVEGGECFVLE